jgi:hypothetical protein
MPVTKEFRPGRPMARAWAGHRGEPFTAAAGHHDSEAADAAVQGVQFGAAAQDGGQLRPGFLIEAVRVLGDPGDGVADRRRGRGCGRCPRPSGVTAEVVAEVGFAARISLGVDLLEQAGWAGLALADPLMQVGLEVV